MLQLCIIVCMECWRHTYSNMNNEQLHNEKRNILKGSKGTPRFALMFYSAPILLQIKSNKSQQFLVRSEGVHRTLHWWLHMSTDHRSHGKNLPQRITNILTTALQKLIPCKGKLQHINMSHLQGTLESGFQNLTIKLEQEQRMANFKPEYCAQSRVLHVNFLVFQSLSTHQMLESLWTMRL